MRNIFTIIILTVITFIFSACGSDSPKNENTKNSVQSQPAQPTATAKTEKASEGVAVAKEILETFDKALAEVVELVKTKPAPAELNPQLTALYQKYAELMKDLNGKYLALKSKDIALFGDANIYLGENRGKHVFNKDNVLGEFISHYNLNGDQETVNLLSKEIVKMLDIAVQH